MFDEKKIKGVKLDWAPYKVTENGRVFSLIKWRWLRVSRGQVWLRDQAGRSKWYKVHRLVATLYVPNPLSKPEIRYRDGRRDHNHYTNLEWVTHGENIKYAYKVLGRGSHNFGKKASPETRQKQSLAKIGERHPKFIGYYYYGGERFGSKSAIARVLGIYPIQLDRMIKAGKIDVTGPIK